jgi:hypothetical protein
MAIKRQLPRASLQADKFLPEQEIDNGESRQRNCGHSGLRQSCSTTPKREVLI